MLTQHNKYQGQYYVSGLENDVDITHLESTTF